MKGAMGCSIKSAGSYKSLQGEFVFIMFILKKCKYMYIKLDKLERYHLGKRRIKRIITHGANVILEKGNLYIFIVKDPMKVLCICILMLSILFLLPLDR